MMPLVSPAPLSACTLAGLRRAYPQPAATSCSVAGGSLPGGGDGGPAPRPTFGGGTPRNMIMTGTGPPALDGATSVTCRSTVMEGYAALSTCPTSCLAITGWPPTLGSDVSGVAVHVTFGTLFGTRPTTSRSKASRISGRRRVVHISAVVTFVPFSSVKGSGRSGKGLAADSS